MNLYIISFEYPDVFNDHNESKLYLDWMTSILIGTNLMAMMLL